MPPLKNKFLVPGKIIALTGLVAATLVWCGFPFIKPATASPGRETPVVRAVKKVSPAVVNISSEYEIRTRSNPFSRHRIDPFFDSFFKDFFDLEQEQKYKRSSLGSGVIIDGTRGFVLTNAHVIAETGTIRIILKDEREFAAQIVGADPDSDLAVLKIDADGSLPAIDMGNSDGLMIGETVIAIGNPFGFSNTVTTGVISALNRSIRAQNTEYHDFIQTDASINPGNSGGPLLNIDGELIGINTAIYAKAQGIGFAIPINKARRIVSDLIKHGQVIQSWIGLSVQTLDDRLARYLQLPDLKGVIVRSVTRDSPADRVGMQAGDVIVSMGHRNIFTPGDYHTALREFAAGDVIPLTVWRKDTEQAITVQAAAFPLSQAMELAYNLLGIKVAEMNARSRYFSGRQQLAGVVITEILKTAYLASIGARPGDIVRKIDDMTTDTVDDFKKAVVRYRNKPSLVILLQRDERLYHITVKL